jgi:hypothetical protein
MITGKRGIKKAGSKFQPKMIVGERDVKYASLILQPKEITGEWGIKKQLKTPSYR